ncbi:MAG: EamA family transporter RarD [Oscillospiraceae bacterium]|nr:EamA family transporter RarD [Oscillospiraceae bacterium]
MKRSNITIAVVANIIFGVMPIYWKFLSGVDNMYILGQRMLWSIPFTIFFAAISDKLYLFRPAFRSRSTVLLSLCSGLVMAGNWFLYTWAVNAGHVADTSMAYYICPLMVFLFGITVFREKYDKMQLVALGFALVGVIIYAVAMGSVPWIALGLAFTFALNGAIKKRSGLDSAITLTVEMTTLLPITLVYLGATSFGADGYLVSLKWWEILLLIGTGFASSFPLWLHGKGINDLPLTLVGVLQYIWPTVSLLVSIFVFKEEVSGMKFVCFGFIWVGLAVFSANSVIKSRNEKISEKCLPNGSEK